MSRNLTPQQIADKQINRLAGARDDIIRGIEGVTEAPTARAAEQLDKAKANYIKAIDSGKTGAALRRVTLSEWQDKTKAKVDRVAEGAAASRSTIEEFHGQRAEHQAKIDAKLKTMPKRNLADSQARMIEQMKQMAAFSFTKRTG